MVQNWELVVQFKVHGKGKELFGDGLALWYAKERMVSGPVFGSKDYFNGLAIILDTYSNHNGPHNVCMPQAVHALCHLIENSYTRKPIAASTSLHQCYGE